MKIQEVYEVVIRLEEKVDNLVDKIVKKEDCKEKHSIINKLVWSLFGVNILGIIGLIITIIKYIK